MRKLLLLLLLSAGGMALSPLGEAQSCLTQAQITTAERDSLAQSTRHLAQLIQANNISGLQGAIAPQVSGDFAGIASSVTAVSALIQGASLTIESLYLLDASKPQAAAPQAASGAAPASSVPSTPSAVQFFCGSFTTQMRVIFSFDSLPAGRYGFAIIHATGVAAPQQMGLVLEQVQGQWKLAGFSYKPLLLGKHDGVWYWTAARGFAKKDEKWNAYFYYATAAYLLQPVSFLTSANLDKLEKEQAAVAPAGLPGEKPMVLAGNGQSFSVTDLHTEQALGGSENGLDLVVRYEATDVKDPVVTRLRNIEVMKAMLAAHPELATAFHGIWVYAVAEGQPAFGVELPMAEIH